MILKGTAEEEEEKKSLDSIVIIITITCSPNIHTNAFLTATLNSIFTQPERVRLLISGSINSQFHRFKSGLSRLHVSEVNSFVKLIRLKLTFYHMSRMTDITDSNNSCK